MGRPKVYDDRTSIALLDVSEQLVAEGGLEALSVRRVASATGATTRAVYSLFGSKDGLVIALGTRAFTLLSDELDALPSTDDPARDVVEAGVVVFRRFTRSHPALFTIGVLQTDVPADIARSFRRAQEQALARLHVRIGRLQRSGQLGAHSTQQAAIAFHALCEGLAALEGRGIMRVDDAEQTWRDALRALVAGWATTGKTADSSKQPADLAT
jgi:AcrR family transcriptional regulator